MQAVPRLSAMYTTRQYEAQRWKTLQAKLKRQADRRRELALAEQRKQRDLTDERSIDDEHADH